MLKWKPQDGDHTIDEHALQMILTIERQRHTADVKAFKLIMNEHEVTLIS